MIPYFQLCQREKRGIEPCQVELNKLIICLIKQQGFRYEKFTIQPLLMWGRVGRGRDGVGQGGMGLKSRHIPVPPLQRGGENPRRAKRGRMGQAKQGKIVIPKQKVSIYLPFKISCVGSHLLRMSLNPHVKGVLELCS